MTFIKKVINADPGTADLVGGNNWDTLDDYFDDVATGLTAKINSNTVFRSGVFKMRNPANSFNYQFVAGAISADRILNWPVITATDTVAVLGLAQTFLDTQTIRQDASDTCLNIKRGTGTIGDTTGVFFVLNDSVGNATNYARITGEIQDNTDTSEDGMLNLAVRINNVMTLCARLDETGKWRCGGLNRRIVFDEAGLTTSRIFTFPDATALLAGQNFANVFTAAQKINLNAQPLFTLYKPTNTTGTGGNNRLEFTLNDSLGNETIYARIAGEIFDATDTSEDGVLRFSLMIAGAVADVMTLTETGTLRCGGSNRRVEFSESGLTAARTFTFPDASALMAGQNFANVFTVLQTISFNAQNIFVLYRTSNTVNNLVGIEFDLQDSGAAVQSYAEIQAEIVTNTAGAEDGRLIFRTVQAGTVQVCGEFAQSGDFKIGNNRRLRLSQSGLTAERTFTFPDSAALVAGSNIAQTFTLTQTFTKSVVLNGGTNEIHVAKTANYTLTADDGTIRADASGGAFTLTLPASASNDKKVYTIIRTDVLASTNMLTIDPNASETIDGQTTQLMAPGETLVIQSDGTNWITRARSTPNAEGYYFLKNSTNNRRYVAGLNPMCNNALLTSTTTPATNTLWAMPFVVSKVTKFDTISFEVTTLIAAKSARVGIYSDNGNCYPGALIFDSGAVSVATTGVKDTTITAGLQVLMPGLYWLTWETDSTVTLQIRILPGAGTCIGFGGIPNTMGTTSPGFAYSVAHTFGALPNPYTAAATLITTPSAVGAPIPAVALRAI